MSGSESSGDDSESTSDYDSLEERNLHRRECEEGDGWSHAFDVEYDSDGNLTSVERAVRDLIHLFTRQNWRKMGDAISQSPALGEILIDSSAFRNELNTERMEALFGGDRVYCCSSLRRVELSYNQFGPGGMKALLPLLKSTPTLDYLNLSGVSNLGEHGARLLADALNFARIEYLDLSNTNIGDAGVEHVLQAENSRDIARLYLQNNRIGRRGLDAISQFLQREDISLKHFFLYGNAINAESVNILLHSLSEKSDLEALSVAVDDETVLPIVPELRDLVCNLSSFEAVCRSNHSLRNVGLATENVLKSNPNLEKVFDINARSKFGASVAKRVRCKLRTFFFRGEFDVQSFSDMDIELMPHILELVTRTEVCIREARYYLGSGNTNCLGRGEYYVAESKDLNGSYRLIRNCYLPELFSFVPKATLPDPEARITALEADNASLRKRVAKLEAENTELRIGAAALPNKRLKTSG